MAKTEILINDAQFQRANVYWAKYYQRAYWRGLFLREPSEFMDSYRRFTRNKQRGPLTAGQVAAITEEQKYVDENYLERAKEMDVSVDVTSANLDGMSSRNQFTFVLQEYLRSRPDIRSVANIGARTDFYSAYLSPRFKDRTFTSVDLQPNLALHNSALPQQPNWHFLSGYCIDLMKSGKLRSDMYFSVSTTVLMNNKELNVYLDEAAKHAKAIAFCEGWWPRADTWRHSIIPPENVPKERPYCSGGYANYHHNYIAKLDERGFMIHRSQIVPFQENFHYLQIIAAKP